MRPRIQAPLLSHKILFNHKEKKNNLIWELWLTPIILATQEEEVRKIVARSQPGQIVCETLS
jgi:hypothetical protein